MAPAARLARQGTHLLLAGAGKRQMGRMERLEQGLEIQSSKITEHFYETEKRTEMQELHKKVYGCSTYNRDCFRSAFENHEYSVKTYFKNRLNDLLILDVSDRDKWGKLCGFLDMPVPSHPYPLHIMLS